MFRLENVENQSFKSSLCPNWYCDLGILENYPKIEGMKEVFTFYQLNYLPLIIHQNAIH